MPNQITQTLKEMTVNDTQEKKVSIFDLSIRRIYCGLTNREREILNIPQADQQAPLEKNSDAYMEARKKYDRERARDVRKSLKNRGVIARQAMIVKFVGIASGAATSSSDIAEYVMKNIEGISRETIQGDLSFLLRNGYLKHELGPLKKSPKRYRIGTVPFDTEK